MTQDCSHPSSTADVNPCQSKSLPKGINIIEADENSAPRVEVVSNSEEEAPWGYIFIRHYLVESFEKKMKTLRAKGSTYQIILFTARQTTNASLTVKEWWRQRNPPSAVSYSCKVRPNSSPLSLKIISPVTISSIIAPRKCRRPSSTASWSHSWELWRPSQNASPSSVTHS